MSSPGPEVVAGHRFDALLDVMNLTSFTICTPEDTAKIDDELCCAACEAVLCDVEHDDSLSLLITVAVAHLACCTNR